MICGLKVQLSSAARSSACLYACVSRFVASACMADSGTRLSKIGHGIHTHRDSTLWSCHDGGTWTRSRKLPSRRSTASFLVFLDIRTEVAWSTAPRCNNNLTFLHALSGKYTPTNQDCRCMFAPCVLPPPFWRRAQFCSVFSLPKLGLFHTVPGSYTHACISTEKSQCTSSLVWTKRQSLPSRH